MDKFEYATLRLVFEDVELGQMKRDDLSPAYPARDLKTQIMVKGMGLSNPMIIDLKKTFPQKTHDYYDSHYFTAQIPPSFVMEALLPQIILMGNEGWEVIEYKFSTEEGVIELARFKPFAFALLKRKVQEEHSKTPP